MQYHLIVADVKYSTVYKCSFCGLSKMGTEVSTHIATVTPEDLADCLRNHPQHPQDMPVGWAHFGNGIYKCERCIENSRTDIQ